MITLPSPQNGLRIYQKGSQTFVEYTNGLKYIIMANEIVAVLVAGTQLIKTGAIVYMCPNSLKSKIVGFKFADPAKIYYEEPLVSVSSSAGLKQITFIDFHFEPAMQPSGPASVDLRPSC